MFPFQISNLLGFIKTNNFSCSTAIDEKLNNPNCTLEDLLDEDEIIQEMKYQNIKLMNFFDKQKVRHLLDYIIKEPKDEEYKKGRRYPFIASEILNSESKIYDLFFIKSNVSKSSIDYSNKNSIDLTDAKVKSKDSEMASFNFEEKGNNFDQAENKDHKQNKTSEDMKEENYNNPNVNDINPIIEEVESINNKDVEIKLEDLHIDQDKNMNITNKNNDNEIKLTVISEQKTSQINKQESILNSNEDQQIINTKVDLENSESDQKENDLLDYFLTFLDSIEPLNYVLSGYFSKFFGALFKKNSNYLLNYIYTNKPDVLSKIVYHSNRKSLVELLPRLLHIDITNMELSKETNVSEKRHNLISEYVLKLKSNDIEEVDNCISVLSDIIDNRNCLELAIANSTFLNTIFEIVSSKEMTNINLVESLNLLILVNKFCWVENCHMPVIAQNKDDSLVSYNEKEIIHSELSLLNKKYLISIIHHFNIENDNEIDRNFTIEGTFGHSYKPLGNKRIKIVEYLLSVFNLMKFAIHEIDVLLIDKEKKLYELLFNYFFEYEWNNIYQLHFDGLMNFILTNSLLFPLSIKYIFQEFNLINFLLDKSKQKLFIFSSNREINHGFWANFIELCSKINSSTNTEITKYFTDEWNQFMGDKVEFWKERFAKKLCPITKNNFNFNFDETQTDNFSNLNFTKEIEKKEETKVVENKPQNANDFFNNFGTNNESDWLNNYSNKNSDDANKFVTELENFEFFEDKNIKDNESKVNLDTQDKKVNFNNTNFENFEGNEKKENNFFSFEENKVEKKDDFSNQVDQILSHINN